MNDDERMQQNIRRTAGVQVLKKIGAIVEEENRDEAARAQALRWLLRYGLVALLLVAAVLGYLMGVY